MNLKEIWRWHKFELCMVGFFVALIALCIWVFIAESNMETEWAVQNHYKKADVKAFLGATEFDIFDLKESDAVFKQFQKFVDGEGIDGQFKKQKTNTVIVPIVTAR